jgi:lipid-A-disaccharide synthase
MTRKRVMVIAGEPSGDLLAAELVTQLKSVFKERGCEAEYFGAGGPQMQAVGVELAFDMTVHALVGLLEVFRNLLGFRRLGKILLQLAVQRRPDLIICVDFSGFNRRFATAVRRATTTQRDWSPKIVQYVSPQVWASREGRAYKMAEAYDLLLAIFPFERAWYAERVPQFKVEFVGHPIVDRYREWQQRIAQKPVTPQNPARIVLLPGSRMGELNRHVPLLVESAREIAARHPSEFRMVLPNDKLLEHAKRFLTNTPTVRAQAHGMAEALADADLAIAKTGTITLECAYFKVPTIAFYKASWSTYQIGKRIVKVQTLVMPHLLANEPVFPELVQNDASPGNIAREAAALLSDLKRRETIRVKLGAVVESLGAPGASRRAAESVANLI